MQSTAETRIGKDGRSRRRVAVAGVRVERKMFTREEVDGLVAALADMAKESAQAGGRRDPWRYRRVELLVRVAAATGARIGELLALRGGNVEAAGAGVQIWLRRGKGSVPGHVWLANGLAAAILERAAVVGSTAAVLYAARRVSAAGHAEPRDEQGCRACRSRPRQPADMACASFAGCLAGVRTRDLRRVQALLGHRSSRTTAVYLALDERERDELVREATMGLEY